MITLAMLTGENGLLSKSLEAKIANEKAEIQDRAETEVLASIGNNGKIDWDKLKDNLASNFKMNKDEITNKGTEPSDGLKFTVEKNKRNYDVDIDEKGKVTVTYEGEETGGGETTSSTEPSEEVGLKPGETASSTKKDNYTDTNNKKATIPQGFTVSSTDYEIDTGLVVEAPDKSEFVWVPVETAITANEEDGNDNKAMAVKDQTDGPEEINYRGILYEFPDGTTESKVWSGCTTTSFTGSGLHAYHEPAYLSDGYSGDAKPESFFEPGVLYNNGRVTEEGLKAEYKAMIESVDQYGGFYVGRYETSLSGEIKAQSKKGQESMSAYTKNGDDTYKWWGMYEKEKNYASDKGISSIIGSSMIWGSQYDAMLNWILKGSDAEKVAKDSEQHGKTTTGGTPGDVMNKIYDLGNNLNEWTLEAHDSAFRIGRGSSYFDTYSPSHRNDSYPSYNSGHVGSRLTLYIL